MWCGRVQSLNSIEDVADVKAADCVQAELALLSDASSHSDLKKPLPSRQHVHMTSPGISLSQVRELQSVHYCCRFPSLLRY